MEAAADMAVVADMEAVAATEVAVAEVSRVA